MKLTDEQLHTLRHMLGINTPNDAAPRPYRNYAAVTIGDGAFLELEQLGAVERYEPRTPTEYHWYRCTEAGRAAAMRSHSQIRRTKSQRTYSLFLDIRDSYPDLTFREFLTCSDFAEARARA